MCTENAHHLSITPNSSPQNASPFSQPFPLVAASLLVFLCTITILCSFYLVPLCIFRMFSFIHQYCCLPSVVMFVLPSLLWSPCLVLIRKRYEHNPYEYAYIIIKPGLHICCLWVYSLCCSREEIPGYTGFKVGSVNPKDPLGNPPGHNPLRDQSVIHAAYSRYNPHYYQKNTYHVGHVNHFWTNSETVASAFEWNNLSTKGHV